MLDILAAGTAAGDALTLDEADFEWGYDCEKWFRADMDGFVPFTSSV